jgi:site-specific DNA-methyltransferase (adenine-specific)/modification methylase
MAGWFLNMEIDSIICGDCLEIIQTMPDDSVDIAVTSPPYNMRTRIRNGEYTTRETSEHFSRKYAHFGDDLPIEVFYEYHKAVLIELLRLCPIIFYNIQIVTGSKEAFFKIIGDFNKNIKDIIIWDKGHGQPAMHDSVINRATELILIFERSAIAGRAFSCSYFGRGTMTDIWRINKSSFIDGHGASFPEELVVRILKGWSKEEDLVIDPFCGTGTTCRVAKDNKRHWIGIDISSEYVQISNERLKQEVLPL